MSLFLIVIYVVCGAYMVLNFKHDIHMLQQNSYRIKRYWKYLKQDIGSTWRMVDVALLFLVFSTLLDLRLAMLIASIVMVVKCFMIFKKKHKKPLVFTNRVWRIYTVSALISLLIFIGLVISTYKENIVFGLYPPQAIAIGSVLLMAIFSWAIVMLAVVVLMPVEG